MPSQWEQVVVDAEDPARLARWWAEALGYRIVHEEPDEVEIRRTPETLPGLLFTPVPEPKRVKNRLHIDLRPDDQEAEVERLVDARSTSASTTSPGWCSPTPRATSSACSPPARRPDQ
jgi:hypothetical protein